MKIPYLSTFALAVVAGFALTSVTGRTAATGCSVSAQFEQVCHLACDKLTSCECSQGENSVCECCAGTRCSTTNTGKNVCNPPPVS